MRFYDPETIKLASLYDLLLAVVEGFPDKDIKAYTKKQKQCLIDNLISFTEENAGMLSAEMNELIYPYPELSYDKLRETLKYANEKYTDSLKKRRNEWDIFAHRFDEVTKDAIIRFVDECVYFNMKLTNDRKTVEIFLTNEYTNSYRQIIYLVTPVFGDNLRMGFTEACDAEIEILDSCYRFSFTQENEIVDIDFSDIHLETQLIDYSNGDIWKGSPWLQISDSLKAIEHKKEVLGMTYLNKKEKALLPLCGFNPIHNLERPYQSVNSDKSAVKLFLDFAIRAGNERVVELTKLYSDVNCNEEYTYMPKCREKKKACDTLHKEMVKPSSEALARLIMSEIKDATCQYPKDVELDIVTEELAEMRKTVTNILKQRGYKGEFPQFKKISPLKGVKVLEIQGQPVIVCNKKHMACMIDCFESSINSADDKKLRIDYRISTIFLKKDELHLFDSLDGRSGFFSHKHRRRARTLTPNFDFRDDNILSYDLGSSVTAAAKTAECEKLTKEERSSCLSISPGKFGCLFIIIFFLLSGLAFSLLFCPAMFLLGLIIGAPITLLSSEAPSFSEYFISLLSDFRWWQMFLICFLGFGGLFGLTMTIYTLISSRRG